MRDGIWLLFSEISHEFGCSYEQRLRNAGGRQRRNVQRRLQDGAEAAQLGGFSARTWRRDQFHGESRTAHENGGAISWCFREDIQTLEQGQPNCTFHDAQSTLRRNRECASLTDLGAAVRTISSSKTISPHRTAEAAKDISLNDAASLDATLAEDRYKVECIVVIWTLRVPYATCPSFGRQTAVKRR